MKGELNKMGGWQGDPRDEDLRLFHDMRRRERMNFLYPLSEDIDSSPSVTRSARDLLPPDSDKNDYNWLLTPPSTPLFPSLDQDESVTHLSARQVLIRSTSTAKTPRPSYSLESTHRFAHGGNPSPKRPSTASATSSMPNANRGRSSSPSLITRSSSKIRASSPRRIVTPTGQNSASVSRSSSRSLTPTFRQSNISPSPASKTAASSGRSRGNSLSPRLTPWEPSLPGFSTEPPPNLRTSLSERNVHRGIGPVSRNRSRVRGSSDEMIEINSASRWQVDSTDGSGNWSLSYSNDLTSSQTSRGSVGSRGSMVSSYEEDIEMAESVASVSTNSDNGSKSTNVVDLKIQAASLRKGVLPSKRQMRSTGNTGDLANFSSLSARRSYERQMCQVPRRSAQAMFRPMLSNAPVTSLYCSRSSGLYSQPSSPFMNFPPTQISCLPLQLHTATEVANDSKTPGQTVCKDSVSKGHDTLEGSGSSLSEEEDLTNEACPKLGHSGPASPVLKGCVENLVDGNDLGVLGSIQEKHEDIGESTGLNIGMDAICNKLKQESFINKSLQEDTGCLMDHDLMKPSIFAQGCIGGGPADQKDKVFLSCAPGLPSCDDSSRTMKEAQLSSEGGKEKENYMEATKFDSVGKTHSLYPGVSLSSSPHVPHRVLSDLGSSRKPSPVKGLYTHSHDGSLLYEKNNCYDFSMSESHCFVRISTSSFDSGCSREEHNGCLGVPNFEDNQSDGNVLVEESLLADIAPQHLEHGSLKEGVTSLANSTGMICEGSECNNHEESLAAVQSTCINVLNQLKSSALESDLINTTLETSAFEASSSNLGNPFSEMVKDDSLSKMSIYASREGTRNGDLMQDTCTEAGDDRPSGFSDTLHATPRLVPEMATEDNRPLKELSSVQSFKRNVTLEEATETILFCSSIVHELIHRVANIAIENEEQRSSKPFISKRDFVALFGFTGADSWTNSAKITKPMRNCKHQHLANATICERSSLVQKQWMVHSQMPAVTMRENPMERIENAIMGNHEEVQIYTPKALTSRKGKKKQGRKTQCRCSCCMM
ncbi:hypothetical protein KP509_03G095500 [Ceratopteris richardii]|uniref:Uncharacterized protein n=1 Tax=Ceratopteris richardii TaxID=49495 RepID=A0A8T2VA84_CERRI|nr:hypothetical protein KP509_03G095500 [Ceratopteris richardii]